MKKYRVVTRDGFILHETNSLKDAETWASQQSKQLQETILVKRYEWDIDDYLSIASIANF